MNLCAAMKVISFFDVENSSNRLKSDCTPPGSFNSIGRTGESFWSRNFIINQFESNKKKKRAHQTLKLKMKTKYTFNRHSLIEILTSVTSTAKWWHGKWHSLLYSMESIANEQAQKQQFKNANTTLRNEINCNWLGSRVGEWK